MNLRATRARAFVLAAPRNLVSYGGRALWAFMCGRRVHEKVYSEPKGGFAFGWAPTMRYVVNSAWQFLIVLAFTLMLMSAACSSARGEVPSPPVLHRCPVFFELLAYSQKPDLRQYGIAFPLLLHAVVMQFQEEISRSENIAIVGSALFCFLDIVCLNGAVDFASETTAQSDQSSRSFREQLLVDSWRVVETIEMPGGHELH